MIEHSHVASLRRRAWFALLLAATVGCGTGSHGAARISPEQVRGTGTGTVARSVIGMDGGTVALPGGARVTVPSNVLTSPVAITLREVTLPATVRLPVGAVRVGKAYTIEPAITATRPFAITFPYDPTLLPAGYEEGSISIYQLISATGQLSMVGSDTGEEYSESAGQDIDIEHHLVTVLVRSPGTYTLLALRF